MSDQVQPKVLVPKKAKRNRGRGFLNFLLILGIIAAIALFAWAEMERRDAIKRLEQTSQELENIKKSTNRQGEEIADEVLRKVGILIELPTEPKPTVATIVDVEELRKSNEFYNKAQNGDHIIITKDRAILYNESRNVIIDVVPVSVDASTGENAASPTPETSPTVVPSITPVP